MFKRNEDLSIYVTRGDCCAFTVPAVINGVKTQFKNGDVIRFKVTKKKDCDTVVRQKDFLVSTIAADLIEINLTGDDTRIGEVISKPTDYWYEVELNPDTNPQTIVGYDDDGAKILRLFPEGADVNEEDIEVLSKKSLQDLVDYTLEEAKKSGAFTGPTGPKGDKGDKGDPGNAAIDTTLTKKGYSADAKAVGDALNGITASKVGAADGVHNASGKEIILSNSVNAPVLGLKLLGKTEQRKTTGKQLLKNGVVGTTKTGGGITFKANADGSITVHGTATTECYWIIDEKNPIDYQGQSLTATVGGAVDGLGMVIGYHREDGTVVNSIAQLSKVPDTFAYPAEAATTRIFIYVSAGRTMNNVTIYPMIRYASVADDTYEPYTGLKASPSPEYPQALETAGNSGSIGLSIGGKNLLSDNGAEWFVSGNYLVFDMNSANRTVTLSLTDRGNNADISGVWFGITDSLENPSDIYFWAVSDGKINSVQKSSNYRYAFMYPYTKEVFDKLFARFNLQVEVGELATEYEPYKGSQTLTASTPNGLPGIPVSTGGNHTDENGQRWICDEKDYTRGVYVQRVKKKIVSEADITYANSSYVEYGTYVMVNLGDAMENPAEVVAISDKLYGISANYRTGSGFDDKYRCYVQSGVVYLRFPAGTGEKTLEECRAAFVGATILYALAEPIETPLSANELSAFQNLHTYKPNTTVYNDSGADMDIRYCIPNTAVPMDLGKGKSGELLTVDEQGYVNTRPMPTAMEVGARPNTWLPTPAEIGALESNKVVFGIDGYTTLADAINNMNHVSIATAYAWNPLSDFPIQEGGRWAIVIYNNDRAFTEIDATWADINNGSTRKWIGKYTQEVGNGIQWTELYGPNNKPTPADIGAATEEFAKNCFLPNGVMLDTSDISILDGITQNGGYRFSKEAWLADCSVIQMLHFNTYDINGRCALQIGFCYNTSTYFVIRWCWYGSWSPWKKYQ